MWKQNRKLPDEKRPFDGFVTLLREGVWVRLPCWTSYEDAYLEGIAAHLEDGSVIVNAIIELNAKSKL